MPVRGSAKSTRQNASTPRTRKRIHDAFLKLVEERDVADISVNDVTNAAGLNRTTFYLHYHDIGTLLDTVIGELTSKQQEGGRRLLERDESEGDGWQETYFGTMAERPQVFLSLLRSTARDALVAKLMRDHESFFLARWEKLGITAGPGGIDLRLCATFVAGGVNALTVDWLESGMPVEPVTISEQAYQLGMIVVAPVEPPRLPLDNRPEPG